MDRVASSDGTVITFERSGTGAPIVLVSPALADHTANAKLARVLNRNLTVINYDRRSLSGDTPPYAVQREIEDIAALIDAAGGSAYLFGSSSGAMLALDAAAALGGKVRALFLYEPPFAADGARRWASVTAPALVMAGGASANEMQHAAQAAAAALPKGKYRLVEGCDHSALTTAPRDIATTMYAYFLTERIR